MENDNEKFIFYMCREAMASFMASRLASICFLMRICGMSKEEAAETFDGWCNELSKQYREIEDEVIEGVPKI